MNGRRLLALAVDAALLVALGLTLLVGYGIVGNRWYRVLAVQGGSMEPAISRGDLIVVVPPPERVEVGMVLTLVAGSRVVTHRVVAVAADGTFTTQGDANPTADDWGSVRPVVYGRHVLTIPLLGRIIPVGGISRASFTAAGAVRQAVSIDAEIGATPTPTPSPTPAPTPLPVPDACADLRLTQVLVGTPGNDRIVAGNSGVLVLGLGGDDVLEGGNGRDCLVGGDGADVIQGGNGRDVLIGGPGADTCRDTSRDRFLECETVVPTE